MACQVIALAFGYAESQSTSWLIYKSDNPVYSKTRKEALLSLTEYLWKKYQSETEYAEDFVKRYKTNMAQCCQKAWRNDKTLIKCPTCEALYNIEKEKEFDITHWQEFLCNIGTSTCDSYGDHYDIENPHNWCPWQFDFNVRRREMLVVQENAEHILTLALFELHPELREMSTDEYGADYIESDYTELLEE